MWKWLLKLWRNRVPMVEPSLDSMIYLASSSGMDRRGYLRVRLPIAPRDIFPQIQYKGETLVIENFSCGGVCLSDPNDVLSSKIGQEIELELHWAMFTDSVKCRLVGCSGHAYRHIQWLEIDKRSLDNLDALVRVASCGKSLVKAIKDFNGPVQIASEELWTGTNGTCLVIFDHGSLRAEVTYLGVTVQFFHGLPPRIPPRSQEQAGRPANSQELAEVLLLLENIDDPSLAVIELVQWLIQPVKPRVIGTVA